MLFLEDVELAYSSHYFLIIHLTFILSDYFPVMTSYWSALKSTK